MKSVFLSCLLSSELTLSVIYLYMPAHGCMSIHTHTCAHMCTHTHTHTHTHILHTYKNTQICAHTHMHTPTYMHTRTHTNTHTHTHTHTHINPPLSPSFPDSWSTCLARTVGNSHWAAAKTSLNNASTTVSTCRSLMSSCLPRTSSL